MKERGNSTEKPRFAIAIPTECVVGANGEEKVLSSVFATDADAVDKLQAQIEEETGHPVKRLDKSSARATFGLSGSWNAPWEPTGPNKNWSTPPSDPTRN